MPTFTDQLGRTIVLNQPPRRIISLVPSLTELLYTLGLDHWSAASTPAGQNPAYDVVGITKFCTHPPSWFRSKPRIGGTKDIHPEKIDALQPDLIIANKEENNQQQVEALATRYPVWVSDVRTLSDALDMIRAIGQLTGRDQQAHSLANKIQHLFSSLTPASAPTLASNNPASSPSLTPSTPGLRTAYLIWRNPWMAAGGDTFIHDMLQHCGLTNLFSGQPRYPTTDPEALKNLHCECVLLSSEPYPFKEKHILEIQKTLPNASIRLVDGQLFSWYGSRLLLAPAYFQTLR